jgi:hypothetical protein
VPVGPLQFYTKNKLTCQGHHYYFLVLLHSEEIFAMGVPAISHNQCIDYYRSLLLNPSSAIVPGKKASWCKQFLGKVKLKDAAKPDIDVDREATGLDRLIKCES